MEREKKKGKKGGGGEKKIIHQEYTLEGKEWEEKKQGGRDEEQSMEGRFLEIEAPLGIRNPVEKCR